MSKGDERDSEAIFTRRAIVMGAGVGLGFAILGGRLYQLQVLEADKYALQSDDNRFNTRLLTPTRGRILDRFGAPLAENQENYTVLIVPENAGDATPVLDLLGQITPLTEERRAAVLEQIRRARSFDSVMVIENLSWRDFAQVNLQAPALPGVLPVVGETRFYPYGEAFAHITGYVGRADETMAGNDPLLKHPNFRVGRDGMEMSLDRELRGEAGALKVEVDAHQRVVRELPDPDTAAKPGRDVRLTLDAGLQEFAMQRLSTERAASAAVVDVQTGDLLALASHPTYDPNHFAVGMSRTEYQSLTEDPANPLFKKAFQGQYPPGSTFKPVVALAAARHGHMNPAERIYCGGSFAVGNTRRACWKAHGSMDLHDALKQSCDVYFYEMARRLGVDRIAETANEFGLGLGLDLPLPGVRAGTIPTEAWKRATIGEPWYPGETVIAGIGQGYITTSPLQLAVMTARLASRRKVIPRLVIDGAAPQFAPMDYSEDAFRAVLHGMYGVCEEPGGTAYNALRGGLNMGEMEMAGKSGTSQIRNITAAERARGVIANDQLPWNRRDHALFIAYAPYDAPRYAVSVIVEHGGSGSGLAGPMARDILVTALERNSGRNPVSPLASRED